MARTTDGSINVTYLPTGYMAVVLLIGAAMLGCGKTEADRFEKSLILSIEANEISVGLPELQRSSPNDAKKKEKLMLRKIEQSLQASDGVSTDFLAGLHPKLPAYYKNYLINGQRLYMEGFTSDDLIKQVQGNALVMEWSTFWVANRDAILSKLD